MSEPTYPVTITRHLLEQHDACREGLAAFDAECPTGELVIPNAAAHVAALYGPLGEWEYWAIDESILPRLVVTVGFGETAVAGYRGIAVAGDHGTATAGHSGTAIAGWRGSATAGYGGAATAGGWGSAVAGHGGTATVGHGGTVAAGAMGMLVVHWWDYRACRFRVAAAYVGEHADGLPDGEVIQANVPYRVEVVKGRPMWRRAEESW